MSLPGGLRVGDGNHPVIGDAVMNLMRARFTEGTGNGANTL
jgi:hypothetical protein